MAAYGVLTKHFFDQHFVEMMMAGQGPGASLLKYLVSTVSGSTLFSSTNMSNRPMQLLFAQSGFLSSGYIDHLDEGDPEIIFYHPAV